MNYFKRIRDLNVSDFYTDLHIHSTWSDGINSIHEIVQQSKLKKLSTIAITDHIRNESTYFNDYYNEIKKMKVDGIVILTGFEVKIKNFQGEVDVSPAVSNKAEVQIASVHRFPLGRKLFSPDKFNKPICQEIELELSIACIRKQQMRVLGHPGGMSIKAFHEFPIAFFREIIIECAHNDIVFELNSAYHAEIYKELMPILEEYNPYLSFATDAHTIKEIGQWPHILNK